MTYVCFLHFGIFKCLIRLVFKNDLFILISFMYSPISISQVLILSFPLLGVESCAIRAHILVSERNKYDNRRYLL